MDSAYDAILGRRVNATEVVRQTGKQRFPERYFCAVCQEEAIYASGELRTYFRHYAEEYSAREAECSLRIGASFLNEPFGKFEFDKVNAQMSCEILDCGDIRFFVLYRPRVGVKRVVFYDGIAETTYRIPKGQGQRAFPVLSPLSEYKIQEFDEDGGSETQFVDGFSQAFVLRRGEGKCVRLPSHRILRAGQYIAILPSCTEQFPASLRSHEMPAFAGLRIVGFNLSKSPTPAEIAFLQRVLWVRVARTSYDYAVLQPKLMTKLADDCWAVDSEGTCVVQVYCDPVVYPSPVKILIQRRTVHGATFYQERLLEGSDGRFSLEFELNSSTSSLIRFGLGSLQNAEFVVEIRYAPAISKLVSASLGFSFSESGVEKSATWSSHRLVPLLRSVREGGAVLNALKIPVGVGLDLVSKGTVVRLTRESGLNDLVQALRSRGTAVVLRAQGYSTLRMDTASKIPTSAVLNNVPDFKAPTRGLPALVAGRRCGVVSAYAGNSGRGR